MAFAIVILLFATIFSPWIYKLLKDHTGWILGLVPLSLFGYGLFLSKEVISGGPLKSSWEWVPSLNIQFSTYFDSLSLLFFLLITGIGSLVLIYGGAYLKGHPQLGRFYPLLLLFMTAMVGVVVSDNLLVLFVFWELTSISSYLLIGFSHENEEARKSALRALTVTGSGGLALLAGIILLGWVGGSYQISDLVTLFGVIRVSPLYLPILLLIFIGAFTKSAQFPFHFWLPGAMVAPTPVSSYLHSATMVKAGFFLLIRLSPVLGATDTWHFTLIGFGTVTMLFGALMAVAQTDLKKLLAYSTISALGLLFLLIGINTELSVKAAILFLVIHSLYKGALFMIAGIIDHKTHTRDVTALDGLFRVMPLVAIAAGLAAFSMSGLPPLLGFIGKELIYEAKVQAPGIYLWVLPLTILANALTVAIAFIVGVRPFWGKAPIEQQEAHKPSWGLWIGPVVLASISLLLGVFPGLINALSNAAATAVRAEVTQVKLSLWHGINPVLMMSLGTLILGLILFAVRERLRVVRKSAMVYSKWGPKGLYENGFNAILEFAKYITDLLQNGSLRFYISTIMGVVVLALGLTLFRVNGWYLISTSFGEAGILDWAIAITIVVAAIIVVTHPSRLVCAIATGVIGYSVALVFILYSAPDLAITQILVETLTVILFVSVVYYLPRYTSLLKTTTKWKHAVLSAAFGILMTLLTLKATNFQLQETISVYFTENSLSQAFGRNVVNVILVDFRALDTLGEIVVLSVAAIGIFAILGWVGRKKEVHER
jgi:multicomponent Na+:H+ antiporter subunit A